MANPSKPHAPGVQVPTEGPQRHPEAGQVEKTHQEAGRLHPPSGPVPPPLRRDRHSSQNENVAATPEAARRGEN